MVQRRSVPAGTIVSCAREVGETSKGKENARKTANEEVLCRMVFLPSTVRTAGGHTMHGAGRERSKSCLNQKDVQRAESTLMRKPKQEQIQRGNFGFERNLFEPIQLRGETDWQLADTTKSLQVNLSVLYVASDAVLVTFVSNRGSLPKICAKSYSRQICAS